MLMVVLVHANYFSLGAPDKGAISVAPGSSFWRVFAEQLCIPGVNVFVLISGWFGIKPSIKGICSLLFQILFFGVLLMGIGFAAGIDVPMRASLKVLFFGAYYWFIPAYIGLYAFSPVLNSFIENTDPKQIRAVLYTFFAIQFVYGWVTNAGSYMAGYSFISFIGLYLLARYLHQYPTRLVSLPASRYFCVFLLATLLPAFYSFFAIINGWPDFSLLSYSSPFVIIASASLLLTFSRLKIKSGFVNWIAISVFPVYLFHLHPVIEPVFKSGMMRLAGSLSSIPYTLVAVCIAITMLFACVLVDKIRLLCWNPLYSMIREKHTGQENTTHV